MQQIVVHHLQRSRSHRILWLLAELDLKYELVIHERDPQTMRAPKTLRQIHPLGKAPVVIVDGVTLAESGAILEYFVERTGKLGPKDDEARIQFRYWMHYAEGSLMPPLLVQLILSKLRTAPLPFFVKPIAKTIANRIDAAYTQPEIDNHMMFINTHLGQHPYFSGNEFSAADIQMSYPVEAALQRGGATVDVANVRKWVERIQARPAYQQALKIGGPQW